MVFTKPSHSHNHDTAPLRLSSEFAQSRKPSFISLPIYIQLSSHTYTHTQIYIDPFLFHHKISTFQCHSGSQTPGIIGITEGLWEHRLLAQSPTFSFSRSEWVGLRTYLCKSSVDADDAGLRTSQRWLLCPISVIPLHCNDQFACLSQSRKMNWVSTVSISRYVELFKGRHSSFAF